MQEIRTSTQFGYWDLSGTAPFLRVYATSKLTNSRNPSSSDYKKKQPFLMINWWEFCFSLITLKNCPFIPVCGLQVHK